MFKKFIALTLLVCFLSVEANAATHNGMKAAFDDLNYALSVEWDQKDKAFYSAQMDKFKDNLTALQKQGVSNQELIEFALAQVKDEKVAKDLRTAFTMISINKMSSLEAQEYVTAVMNKSYNQGASFIGSVILTTFFLVAIVAVAAIVAGKARVEEGCYQVWTCDDYCTGNLCYEDCYYECI